MVGERYRISRFKHGVRVRDLVFGDDLAHELLVFVAVRFLVGLAVRYMCGVLSVDHKLIARQHFKLIGLVDGADEVAIDLTFTYRDLTRTYQIVAKKP